LELQTLNLASNRITKIEGLHNNKKLSTLNLANNNIRELSGLQALTQLPELNSLDLSNNEIDDERVVGILKRIPNLQVLYLKGNPVVERIEHYRKMLIATLPLLHYLDDKPVTEEERRAVTAWMQGGPTLENEVRKQIHEEKLEKHRQSLKAFQRAQDERRQNDSGEISFFSDYGRENDSDRPYNISPNISPRSSPRGSPRMLNIATSPRSSVAQSESSFLISSSPISGTSHSSPLRLQQSSSPRNRSVVRHINLPVAPPSPRQKIVTETTIIKASDPSGVEHVLEKEKKTIIREEDNNSNHALQHSHSPVVSATVVDYRTKNSQEIIHKVHEVVDAIRSKLAPSLSPSNRSVNNQWSGPEVETQKESTETLPSTAKPTELQTTDDKVSDAYDENEMTEEVGSWQPTWTNKIRDSLLRLVRKHLFDWKKISSSLRAQLAKLYNLENNVIHVKVENKIKNTEEIQKVRIEAYSDDSCRKEYNRIMAMLEKLIESGKSDPKKVGLVVKPSWEDATRAVWNDSSFLF
jgi:hypothetical protein